MAGLTNHIGLVIDRSTSMEHLSTVVPDVVYSQIAYLARRSKELDQETRVSVFLFADTVECVVWDTDVLRMPSIASLYRPYGNTALLDATSSAIDDLMETPQKYGDHAFLIFVLTDGQENRSRRTSAKELAKKIIELPRNWTLGVLVPDYMGVFEAKSFGFPANNISVWSTQTARGFEEAGSTIQRATDAFMQARSTGVRSTKNLFAVDTANLTAKNVVTNLRKINATRLYVPAGNTLPIAEFVEAQTGREYVKGSAFYQLTKPETVQADKKVIVVHRKTGDTYGGADARSVLGLPDYEVRVSPPSDSDEYLVYVQSNSVNRRLVPGTVLLVTS